MICGKKFKLLEKNYNIFFYLKMKGMRFEYLLLINLVVNKIFGVYISLRRS